MDRREFLQHIGSVLALALTPAFTSCATVGGPDLQALAKGPGLAEQLRAHVRAIRTTVTFPRVSEWLAERGFDGDLPGRMVASLWSTSTFRDLPRHTRRSPEVQAWLKDEVPGIAATTFEVADLLEGLTPDDRDALTTLLEEETDLHAQLVKGMEASGATSGVEPERVQQLRDLTGHAIWRLRHQSPAAVIDDYLERVDRTCRRRGVDRATWREQMPREIASWNALDLLSDPSGEAFGTAEGDLLPPDALESLATAGGHLGITMRYAPHRAAILVEHVHPGSPAQQAGLQAGDRLKAVDGRALGTTELLAWLRTRSPGEEVTLSVARGRERLARSVPLGDGPGDRITVSDLGTAARMPGFGYLSAGVTVLGVGLAILGSGALMFVIGLATIESDAGQAMTVVGAGIMLLGLLVSLIGLIVMAAQSARRKRHPPQGLPPQEALPPVPEAPPPSPPPAPAPAPAATPPPAPEPPLPPAPAPQP